MTGLLFSYDLSGNSGQGIAVRAFCGCGDLGSSLLKSGVRTESYDSTACFFFYPSYPTQAHSP